jgi:hypothetical protein
MKPSKYSHRYPITEPQEQDKYLPSIFKEVEIDNQLLKVEIRPLRKDIGYFTITINSIFLGHIHKVEEKWVDFVGSTNEIYMAVGKVIDEHLGRTTH